MLMFSHNFYFYLLTLFVLKLYSYSLEHTVQFLNCVLEGDPVKTVVAPEFVHQNENATSYTAQKSKEKKVQNYLFFTIMVNKCI